MSIRRLEDGSIPERQDRPGYAKHWVYEVQATNLVDNNSSDWVAVDDAQRLDQAIQLTLNCLDDWKVRIVQTTTTVVWYKGSDIGPIGEFPEGLIMFSDLADCNFGGK